MAGSAVIPRRSLGVRGTEKIHTKDRVGDCLLLHTAVFIT